MPEVNGSNGLILKPDLPVMRDRPSDTIPPVDRGDITNLDEDKLRSHIIELFRNDIADKRQVGWEDKRAYDIQAYYGLKNEALKHFPWEGASAFPVPLTPTILDTAWANIQASIFSNPNGPVRVNGVSVEDIRTSKSLEDFLNWQVMNETDMETEQDKNVFRTFLHGTGFVKVIFDAQSGQVKIYSIDIENMFVPLDARGLQPTETDHVIHIVPLTYNDLQMRKAMGIYRYPDEIKPGIGIIQNTDAEYKQQMMDLASGTSLTTKNRRDNYYVAECYLTYVPPGSSRPLELIVWMAPNGGRIQRIRLNKKKMRPFADSHAYPFPDRFYSMSMPEKIRNIQEKIDYADKQNTDALDRAISPAAFVDDTDAFDRSVHQRVPGGIYPKGKGNTIDYEPMPTVERGFERMQSMLWEQAERITGIIDVTQGRSTSFAGKTLGEIEIRSARADVRFSSIYKRFERGFKKQMNIVYELDNEFIDRKKKIRVLGYKDFRNIDEIFPAADKFQVLGLGINGTFDFSFSGSLISDKDRENEKKLAWLERQKLIYANDRGTMWKIGKAEADALGVRDAETIISKPPEADIISVEEFIERVMSGQIDIQIRPGIDTERYIFEIQLFMQTETFANLDPGRKKTLSDALRRAYVMGTAERRAKLDLQLVMQSAQMQRMAPQLPAPEVQG